MNFPNRNISWLIISNRHTTIYNNKNVYRILMKMFIWLQFMIEKLLNQKWYPNNHVAHSNNFFMGFERNDDKKNWQTKIKTEYLCANRRIKKRPIEPPQCNLRDRKKRTVQWKRRLSEWTLFFSVVECCEEERVGERELPQVSICECAERAKKSQWVRQNRDRKWDFWREKKKRPKKITHVDALWIVSVSLWFSSMHTSRRKQLIFFGRIVSQLEIQILL